MNKRLLLLVEDRGYVRSNCYLHQLVARLEAHYRVTMLSRRDIEYLPWFPVGRYARVLSLLRLRTLDPMRVKLARLLRGQPVHIYEQDVWMAYMDDSPWRGAYGRIADTLNVASFLVTSKWWTDYVAARGLPVRFVRMGMLPQYCDPGPDWSDRPIPLGFQGTLHPHRRRFFEQLAALGLDVRVLPSASYEQYLRNLHGMRIYVHTEDSPWTVDGRQVARNALWIKETEVAARGTFVMREVDEDAEAYGISELPTVFTFRAVEEVPAIVASIQALPRSELRARMVRSAETMRRRDDWMTVVRAIEH